MRWRTLGVCVGVAAICACGGAGRLPARTATAPEPSLAAFSPGIAEPSRKARLVALAPALDGFFSKQMQDSGATGMAVGVVLEGELVYERGFGVRDLSSSSPVDSDTVFRIASLTKSFTALSVMQLRDEGKLALDAPAADYFPELRLLVPPTRDSPPITARLLMTHASGLAYDDIWGAVTFGQNEAQLHDLLRSGVSFSSTPGTHFAYSNLGYALLGQIVARVSRMGYRDYVSQRILRPLGMNATVWQASEVRPGRLATGYHREGARLVADVTPDDGVFAPAGGLYTSLHDYARYAAWNLAAYPPRDDPEAGPVRRSTLREMHAGQREERGWGATDTPIARRVKDAIELSASSDGFGWHSVASCTEERVSHGGSEPGYFAHVVLLPKARLALVILATSAPVGGSAYAGALTILREGAVLVPPAALVPHPALIAARAALRSLVNHWDEALFERTFDPHSLEYWWNQTLPGDFAKLARDHGRCGEGDALELDGALHGTFRLECQRGAITFELLESPAIPARLQNMQWREEFPVDAQQTAIAERLAVAVDTRQDSRLSELFDPQRDLTTTRRAFARLALEHSSCAVERGVFVIEHAPLSNDLGHAEFTLKCNGGSLELAFSLDQQTGKARQVSLAAPHAPGAACW